jgi:thioredoxin 1
MSDAQEITDTTFQAEVLESDVPVLVDFWAPWCGPCRAMTPAIDAIASEMSEQLKVVKHNTQDSPNTPSSLGVMALPTFLLFKGGKEVGRHTGMMSVDDLRGLVSPHL